MRNPEQLNSRIREIMEQYQAAGLAAAVIDRSGSTLYEQYFGYRNAETKEPVNEDTVFGLASVTKSFTALCIMKMAEDGLLDTDDPVSQYLPEFDDHHGKIRIRHLLSHSAGFWPLHRTTIAEVRSRYALNSEPDPADDITLAEKGAEAVIAQMNKAEDFIDAPGIYSSYCNDGFGLLSEIIRRHGDCDTYPEYLEKHILVPLGMTRSSCRFTPVDDNAAVLYRIENGQRTGDRDYTRDAFTLHGGGAMKSTLHDTKQYLGMYLNEGIGLNGREIVKERCIRSMYMPRIPFGGTSYYGYGLYSDTQDHQTIYRHSGSLPGVSSAILFCYETGLAAVVLCNTSGVPVSGIGEALLRFCTGKELFPGKTYPAAVWSAEVIQNACGHYHTDEDDDVEIRHKAEHIVVISNGIEHVLTVTGPYTGVLVHPYTETDIELIHTRKRGIYGLRYGSRILKKES